MWRNVLYQILAYATFDRKVKDQMLFVAESLKPTSLY